MKNLALISLLFVVTLFGACSGQSSGLEKYTGMSDSEIVAMRTKERWEAIIEGKWETVYGFASPAYRKAYDFTHFSNQYASQIRRRSVDVVSVDIDESDGATARVVVRLHYVTAGFSGGDDLELSSSIKETWTKESGMWWFVETK